MAVMFSDTGAISGLSVAGCISVIRANSLKPASQGVIAAGRLVLLVEQGQCPSYASAHSGAVCPQPASS